VLFAFWPSRLHNPLLKQSNQTRASKSKLL
jgi:hypothetical protein